MKPIQHTIISVPVSGALYAVSQSWEMALASLVTGVLVDFDHCLDYVREYGVNLDIRNFLSSFPEGRYRKVLVLLHAWELIVVLAVASWLTAWNPWLVGAAVGLGHHLICDQLTNGASPLGYSLLWRLANGFDPSLTFPFPKRGYAWNKEKE